MTPISVGDPAAAGEIPEVHIEWYDANSGNWMSDIHNHPSGDGRLSEGEWVDFINQVSTFRQHHPDRTELAWVSVYVVVLDPTSPSGYRIYAYTMDTPPNQYGQEVNPNAQPCSQG